MMTTQEQYIAKMKQLVIKRYGANISSADDCAALSDEVERSVGVRIDMPTLQMLFSRNSRMIVPRPMVLSALAKYVGYEDWSDYCTSSPIDAADDNPKIPIHRRWGVIIATIVGVAAVVMGILLLANRSDETYNSSVPTPYDAVVEDVAMRYVALTEEHYLSLRLYDGTNRLAFEKHVNEFLVEYENGLQERVAEDIRSTAAMSDVDISHEDVNGSAQDIAARCMGILEELLDAPQE